MADRHAAPAGLPRVVIIGAGFGGVVAAKALRHAPARITVVDRRNYHLFQPLLYQVATASLSPADIATPIRAILRHQKNTQVLMARVTGIDRAAREIILADTDRRLSYDYLVIAAGARHAYFGHDEWEAAAPSLKRIDDATAIRHRILAAFERAEAAADPEERQRLLTFVIVGGGATGVELAGAIAELAKKTMVKDFRSIDPASARIILIEAGQRLMTAFPEKLAAKARRALERLGAEVLTETPVEQCDAEGVIAAGRRIAARTVLWAAGVEASAAAKWLQAEKDGAGRVEVAPDLSVPGAPDIFVIGDTALVIDRDGKPVPGIAPAAKQMGAYVAKVIGCRISGEAPPGPFRYRHVGNFATIGRHAAIADFGWLRMNGYLAWLLWGIAHIYFLIDFRSRIVVMLEWIWAYLTFRRSVRLITGSGETS